MAAPNFTASDSPLHDTGEPSPAPRHRPFGLYAILILLSIQALLGMAVVGFLGLGMTMASADTWEIVTPHAWSVVDAVITMVVAGVVAVGLWRYRLWAWYTMMLLLAYLMAADAVAYFRGSPDYYSMVLNVVMVFYLNQREVRHLFEAQPPHRGVRA